MVLILSIPDIWVLPHFLYSHEYRLARNTVYCAILSDQIVVGCPLGVPISYYFQYGFQGGRQRSRDYLFIMVQIKVLYISNILCKFYSDRLNDSGDTQC